MDDKHIEPSEFHMVGYRLPDGRTYARDIEDVTHFRRVESGDYEHPIRQLRSEHERAVEDEELRMLYNKHKPSRLEIVLWTIFWIVVGTLASWAVAHFRWGQLM